MSDSDRDDEGECSTVSDGLELSDTEFDDENVSLNEVLSVSTSDKVFECVFVKDSRRVSDPEKDLTDGVTSRDAVKDDDCVRERDVDGDAVPEDSIVSELLHVADGVKDSVIVPESVRDTSSVADPRLNDTDTDGLSLSV